MLDIRFGVHLNGVTMKLKIMLDILNELKEMVGELCVDFDELKKKLAEKWEFRAVSRREYAYRSQISKNLLD